MTPDNIIGIDVPCRRCGYNLRGLRADSLCPECALPVWPSLRPGLVGFGEPQFIDFLRRGALLLAGGTLALFGGAILSRTFVGGTANVVRTFAVVLSLLGCWILTERDQSGLGEAESGGLRRAARGLVFVAAALLPLGMLRDLAAGSAAAQALVEILATVITVAAFAGVFLMLRFLRRMSFRLFEPVLARRMAWLSYQVLACTVGFVGTGVTFVAVLQRIVPAGVTYAVNLRPLVFIAVLITAPQAAYACWRLANALAAHAVLARQSWPKNDAACAAIARGDDSPAP